MSPISLSHPFDNPQKPWLASLNQAQLIDLPGIDIPDVYKNQSGSALLSARSLLQLFKSASLGKASKNDLLPIINQLLNSHDPEILSKINALALDFGQRLGYFFLMLSRGDSINRQARPKDFLWIDAQWQFWSQVDSITLAGGLITGEFGLMVLQEANQLLKEQGSKVSIKRYPFYRQVCLIGLARRIPACQRPVLLFDFGKTHVKIACAHYQHQQLSRLQVYPHAASANGKLGSSAQDLQAFAQWIIDTIEKNWWLARSEHPDLAPFIGLSMGCSIIHGNFPLRYGGIYSKLRRFIDDFPSWLVVQLQKRTIFIAHAYIHNDSDCAAFALDATENQTEVIVTLGTGLGVGFPKNTSNVFQSVSADFAIMQS